MKRKKGRHKKEKKGKKTHRLEENVDTFGVPVFAC